ncbi:catalytic activity protein [Rutstroemia sp. NJR-2017a BBW]|nr:catalytic activity protein [Rutstroemia sp. NJR-2017a BBW]
MRQYSHASESLSGLPQEKGSPHSSVQRRISQNDYIPAVPSTIGADSTPAQQVLSPEQLYAPTPYSLGSNDSLVLGTRSSLPQPTFNAAIAKWFDMLVGDADFENAISSFDVNGDNLDTSQSQDPNHIPSSRRVSAISDAPGANVIPPSLHPQLLERNTHAQDRIVTSEKLRWQLSNPIEELVTGYDPTVHPSSLYDLIRFYHRPQIDLFDPAQNFSTFVPHLALHNTGLMKAILALSTRHLSRNPSISQDTTHNRNDALQYYNETLHYLSKAMQYDTYKTSLELLATALIVSTYEMLDGSGKDWERHLQGVFWIQRSQVIHGDSKGLKQAVWWAWLCQDIWAAFREKRKAFTFWKPVRTYAELNPWELASRSVYLMAQVVNYCSREELDNYAGDIGARIDKAARIENMLDDWYGSLTVEFTPLPLQGYTTGEGFSPIWIRPPAFGVALQLHYSARLLLLLNQPSRGGFGGYIEQGRRITKYVANICGIAMTLTDNASSVMCSQCLFIVHYGLTESFKAGMCIQEPSKRESVLDMIDACRQRTGWPIKPLGEELKAFWDAPENVVA